MDKGNNAGGVGETRANLDTSLLVSRRAVLAASSAGLASLTGCLFGQSSSTDDLCGGPSNPLPENELNVVSGSGPANIGSETHWRHFRSKDPQGTRSLTNGQPPTESVRVAWSTELDRHESLGGPVIAGRQVYIVDKEIRVAAFDAVEGVEQWRSESLEGVVNLIANDDTIIVGDSNRVWSLSAQTGTEQTEYLSASGAGAAVEDFLLIDETTLLVAERTSDRTLLYAFDSNTAERLWQYEYNVEDNPSEASLIAANSETAFFGDYVLHAVDLETGTRRWSSDTAPFNASLTSNRLHSRRKNKIEAFDIQDDGLNQTWKFKGEDERIEPLSVGGEYLAATSRRGQNPRTDDGRNLYMIDSDSGSVEWCHFTGGTGTPAIGGETVYVSIGDLIYAFDLSTGDALWRYELSSSYGASIALVDGAVIYKTVSEVGALTAA